MSALYIHIPFCKKICYYCDFYFSLSLKNKDEMMQAMVKEIELKKDFLQSNSLQTIYFGGGTPSVLSESDLSLLFDTITKYFDISECKEISFEANPDDLTTDYLKMLKSTPIDRLSVGIQSFNDEDLSLMNRRHTAQEAHTCLESIFDIGFTNVTADLMYGLPKMTIPSLDTSINSLLQYPINHISAYNLTIENGTAFSGFVKKKKITLPSDSDCISQADHLRSSLQKAGYEQYEISNFARDEQYSIHNTAYWKQIPYIGIGPSAHSYNGTIRQWNVSNNRKYIELIISNSDFYESETLSKNDVFNELIFTSLRTKWGLERKYILNNFGTKTLEYLDKSIQPYIANKQITNRNNTYILTDTGKAMADAIASDLFIID